MYLGKYYAYLHRIYETIIPIHKIYYLGFMTSHLIQRLVGGTKTLRSLFYVLLTVHPFMILVNNQTDAQFFHLSILFLSFRRVLNVNYSFLGNSPASEF